MAAMAHAGTALAQPTALETFRLPAPATTQLRDARMIELTALQVMMIVPAADATIPLLDAQGARLGPVLDEGQFCELAAAGAGVIEGASYRVVGSARAPQLNCRRYFSRLARKMPVAAGALGRSVFVRIEAAYGLGARDFKLVPWRSVATAAFPLGAVLYLPSLRGQTIAPGRIHDGYVFVADVLGDAPRDRIALLVDAATLDPAMARRGAVRVDAPAVIDALSALHRTQ